MMKKNFLFLLLTLTFLAISSCSYAYYLPRCIVEDDNVWLYEPGIGKEIINDIPLNRGDTIYVRSFYPEKGSYLEVVRANGRWVYFVLSKNHKKYPLRVNRKSVRFLDLADPGEKSYIDEKLFITLDQNAFHSVPKTDSKVPVYVMAILAVILIAISRGGEDIEYDLNNVGNFFIMLAIYLVLCCLVIWYFKGYTGNVLWFTEDMGLIRSTIAETLYFLFVAAVLMITYYLLLKASSLGGFGMYFITGIVGSVLIIPVYIVTSFTSEFPIRIINDLFIWTHIIQLVILTGYCLFKRGNLLYLLLCYIIYCVGMLSSYIVIAHYIWLWVKGQVVVFNILTILEHGLW